MTRLTITIIIATIVYINLEEVCSVFLKIK